jgi:hypothetical protein
MGFLDIFRSAAPAPVDYDSPELELLTERLAELELALEDVGWVRLGMEGEREFSREGLDRITQISRYSYLKNPLIRRGVEVQRLYVFGQGISIRAEDEQVNEVVQAFLTANKSEFRQSALGAKEVELQVAGNLFTAIFSNIATGEVRVRSFPAEEIRDIVTNPDDRGEPWFYLRAWNDSRNRRQEVLFPDWEYDPAAKPTMYAVDGRTRPVDWSVRIHHIKVGGFSHMRFGVPEVFSGLDWSRAYKEFLEDWATIVRSYARFAWKRTTKGGKAGVAAAKAKMHTGIGASSLYDTNPPPTAGAMAIMAEGNDLTPIKTAGATTSAEDGRRMLLMVAAAMGLPETFFGDASVGTVATAKSLDRPTELMMVDRQSLWGDYFDELLQYVIDRAMAARSGPLPATLSEERRHLDIDWPPILEQAVSERVQAIVTSATLDGKALAGTMDLPAVSRMLLSALGEDDVDQILAALFPEGWEDRQAGTEAQESFVEAVRTLREAVADLARD